MDMIYANSQCASIYFQVFDMNDAMLNEMYAIQTLENEQAQYQEDQSKAIIQTCSTGQETYLPKHTIAQGTYMYVEMAHYTDDDTVVLICLTNANNFEVQEVKLEKLQDKNWQFIIERFCSGNSSDQILNNVETLFASLEFQTLVKRIYVRIMKGYFIKDPRAKAMGSEKVSRHSHLNSPSSNEI